MTEEALQSQEAVFAKAFAAGDMQLARELYHPDVVYLSPTVRLYDWPDRIEGIDKTLEFIQLTIDSSSELAYQAVEFALVPANNSAFVRIHYDFICDTESKQRLRSNYISLYRFREDRIVQQEIYYDPSGKLETLSA